MTSTASSSPSHTAGAGASSGARTARTRTSLFPPIPAPLQRLFDLVPLVTYPANTLPGEDADADTDDDHGDGTESASRPPTLYVFLSPADAARGRPSFNPTCLKWQTYLRFANLPVRLVPSSNHASPTGALPFLLPAQRKRKAGGVVAAHELPGYVKKQRERRSEQDGTAAAAAAAAVTYPPSAPPDPAAPAYQALLDTRIRRAWLHAVYLYEGRCSTQGGDAHAHAHAHAHAAGPIAARLYAQAASSSGVVQASLARQLAAAAAAEVWPSAASAPSSASAAETAQIYADAQAALAALATLLDEQQQQQGDGKSDGMAGGPYFFGRTEPTLFDAAVFSYTHLLLEDDDSDDRHSDDRRFCWQDRTLPDMVAALPSLVQHRNQILEQFWPEWNPAPVRQRPPVAASAPGEAAGVADSVAWVQV